MRFSLTLLISRLVEVAKLIELHGIVRVADPIILLCRSVHLNFGSFAPDLDELASVRKSLKLKESKKDQMKSSNEGFPRGHLILVEDSTKRALWDDGAYVVPVTQTSETVEDVDLFIRRAERCLEAGADMIPIDADDVCKYANSVRADVIAKFANTIKDLRNINSSDEDWTNVMTQRAAASIYCNALPTEKLVIYQIIATNT
ncbi:hypothetical protein Vadar_003859 [Vaccinium darrowii]|uniref:Uncharacterized protein n=1 Tax=Vaccinium darrowii TaxID=229202 RepID=A0ACB7Z2C8_9ERIC|nr:hypothetical protein Vadar_003859 [Vaccinium darrowii]